MSPQPTPTADLSVNFSPGDSTTTEERFEACGDSNRFIDLKRQKIIDDKIWQKFCKNIHEDICEKIVKNKKREEERSAGLMRQSIRCAEVALAYWNRCQKSNGEPEYLLVAGRGSCPFFEANMWWHHTTFKARVKDDPAAKPECFFAEIKGDIYANSCQEVTKICVLLPTDKGSYDCKACSRNKMRHPASGGFNLGQLMSTVDSNIAKSMRIRQAKKREARLKAREQNVGKNDMQLKAGELNAKEQSVATRTRSRTREQNIGSTSNN